MAERLERARRAWSPTRTCAGSSTAGRRRALLEVVERHHGRIAAFIENGVLALGPDGAVRLIEEHAGDDLQYIRVNGTRGGRPGRRRDLRGPPAAAGRVDERRRVVALSFHVHSIASDLQLREESMSRAHRRAALAAVVLALVGAPVCHATAVDAQTPQVRRGPDVMQREDLPQGFAIHETSTISTVWPACPASTTSCSSIR